MTARNSQAQPSPLPPRSRHAQVRAYTCCIVQTSGDCHLAGVCAGSPSKGDPVAGERVLIVDDDADTVVICSAQLTHAGYSVTSISDGANACNAARLHMPDVILLDYRLPGTTGSIIAAGLNADPRCSAIPVIIL